MGGSSAGQIGLHAGAGPRKVLVGGDDEHDVRVAVTARLATLLGNPPAVVLTSACSSAIDAAASRIDLQPGDEVVVPAFTFPTSVIPFVSRGARLRFADADPHTGNVTPAEIARLVGERTKAVVVMHYAGVGVDLEPVEGLLADRHIPVIEDAAQGIFATAGGRPLGTLGRFGALSFHRTKNVSTLDGGALVVNHPADIAGAHIAVDKGTNRVEFDEGRTTSYEWSGLGGAARMSEAAVRLLADDLDRAAAAQPRRHAIWDRYQADLAGWAASLGVGLPFVPSGREHPAHLFFLVLPDHWDRAAFVADCAAAGVQTARHYGSLPLSQFGRTVADPADECPEAARLGEQLVRIPLHPELTDQEVERVVQVVTGLTPRGAPTT